MKTAILSIFLALVLVATASTAQNKNPVEWSATSTIKHLPRPQIKVLEMLYDVWAEDQASSTQVEQRYYSSADALTRKGMAVKTDRFPLRPVYCISAAGRVYFESMNPESAQESRQYWQKARAK